MSAADTAFWRNAIPHREIREGTLNPKVFAIDLAQVLSQGKNAPVEYRDAESYFRHTYLTRGLRAAIVGVLQRLDGQNDGVSITQLATVFGGGKTHTLLGLYHTVANGAEVAHLDVVQQLLDEAELDEVPAARIAAVDCAQISPAQPRTTPDGITLRTLWGEIAYRLGEKDGRGAEFYEFVRSSDEALAAPGGDALDALFAAVGPSLILIDETLSYITAASAIPAGKGWLSDQAQTFLLQLTRAVGASDNVALVITMTVSRQEQHGEAAFKAAQEVDSAIRVVRRTKQVEVSAEKEELYEILKRRLFETEPDEIEAAGREVANEYWEYYRANGSDFSEDVQSPEYRSLMVRAYPFHPTLIELLRDRWGSIQGFQRTRGVLRLLAQVIGDLYQRQHPAPMIQPANINLDNGRIRAELLQYVDRQGEYESAVTSDIGGAAESKAPRIDQTTGGDYARYNMATGLATAIFLYSHSGATDRPPAVGRPQLWVSSLRPGIVPALASDALDRLQKRLWYLVEDEGTYRIDHEPNLNQMLVTRVEAARQDPDRVRDRVKTAVGDLIGRGRFDKTYLWPEEPQMVDDYHGLSLLVMGPECQWDADRGEESPVTNVIRQYLQSARTFRQFKNTLIFLLPTTDGVTLMQNAALQLLALESIHRQYGERGLSKKQSTELEDRLDKARKGLPGTVWGAYTVVVVPTGNGSGDTRLWSKQEFAFAGYRPGLDSLSERARNILYTNGRLIDKVDPKLISKGKEGQWRLWAEQDETLNVATLSSYFARFPYLPMLSGPDALKQTIAQGVQRGLFAYAYGDGTEFDTIYYDETRSVTDFDIVEGAWLLRPSLAQRILEEDGKDDIDDQDGDTGQAEEQGGADEGTRATKTDPETGTQPVTHTYQHVSVDTPVDPQRLFDFYDAVVVPLVEAGMDVKIHLKLDAEGEVEMNLIDLSVRESALQFNVSAKVKAK